MPLSLSGDAGVSFGLSGPGWDGGNRLARCRMFESEAVTIDRLVIEPPFQALIAC